MNYQKVPIIFVKTAKVWPVNPGENIKIVSKEDKSGIDIIVKPNTPSEHVYIPASVSCGGITDLVYNDFYIGRNADVTVIAGCGVSTGDSCDSSQHNGIHRFFLARTPMSVMWKNILVWVKVPVNG